MKVEITSRVKNDIKEIKEVIDDFDERFEELKKENLEMVDECIRNSKIKGEEWEEFYSNCIVQAKSRLILVDIAREFIDDLNYVYNKILNSVDKY